ncbi:hypothetical protein N7519_008021 [Penicillium mononematosum]|uniref:uncharacterized protein n=1 Tax=Penicillium mononematosum TaxID=268346 RepID=UPI00254839AB|nr:uncharacterized protein N7519_008021 [Penicillium mononematosum]KAJ6186720.1 hypothetical protein N7519_008021 [Penicillium mononematosum]
MAMATTTDIRECTCSGYYEELRAELHSLRTAVTSPNLRSAGVHIRALVDDPTQAGDKIRTALQDDVTMASIDIVGLNPPSRATVKVFADSDEGVSKLRRATYWLDALPGAQLQGGQWYPVKLNDVKKESV